MAEAWLKLSMRNRHVLPKRDRIRDGEDAPMAVSGGERSTRSRPLYWIEDDTMEAAGLQPGTDTFDRILGADSPVVVLETEQSEVLVEQFRQVARRSGQAVYVWRRDAGLHSLREGDVRVPGCQRIGDTLRYVLQSMHFGVYLITDVESPMGTAELALLRQLARARADHVRRVVLLGEDSALADSLEGTATVINCRAVGGRPRLRDGRWVI